MLALDRSIPVDRITTPLIGVPEGIDIFRSRRTARLLINNTECPLKHRSPGPGIRLPALTRSDALPAREAAAQRGIEFRLRKEMIPERG